MVSNLSKYRNDLARLIKTGDRMLMDLSYRASDHSKKLDKESSAVAEKIEGTFEIEYQRWYTEACSVIHQILPNRLREFEQLYEREPKRKVGNVSTYCIQDWIMGIRATKDTMYGKAFNDLACVFGRFNIQLGILEAANVRFESSLFEIRQLLQADLFDHELDAARELTKNGFLRAAGAVSGVVLEAHLAEVCDNHKIVISKKGPNIGDLNDALKNAEVLEVPTWRFIQRLGALRNLCDHDKKREPTKDEVLELIDGTDKLAKILF